MSSSPTTSQVEVRSNSSLLESMAIRRQDPMPEKVVNHFARLSARARSREPLVDVRLASQARDTLKYLQGLLDTEHPEAELYLSYMGFDRHELQRMWDVVNHRHKWSRSIPNLNELWEALERYGMDNEMSADPVALEEAWAAVERTIFRVVPSPRKPTPIDETLDHIQKSKSSGFPMMMKKEDDFARASKEAKRLIRTKALPPPCVAGVRIQQKATGAKTRLVWMYPMAMTLIEGMFAPRVVDVLKDWVPEVAYSKGNVDTFNRSRSVFSQPYICETDLTAFDSSIHESLIRRCFSILEKMFDLKEQSDKAAWERMVEYFIHTPILMPDGRVYVTHRGVPSGSWFTNVVDSMVNMLLINYCALREKRADSVLYSVLGDDAIIGTRAPVNLEAWSEFARELGLHVSTEKSKVTLLDSARSFTEQRPYFLGRYWERSGAWFRPTHLTLARLLYPERWSKDGMDDPVRVSRIVAHAMDNPVACQLLYTLITRDPTSSLPKQDSFKQGLLTAASHRVRSQGRDLVDVPVTGRQEFLRSIGAWEFNVNRNSWAENVWSGYPVFKTIA